jgi:predicted esterase YcpF (UPF0227 family)
LNIDLSLPPQLSRPTLFDIIREVRAPFEFASIALNIHTLRQAPKGDGRAVMLVPGYLADDYSMGPLGAYLRYLGYAVYYTEMGRNMGKVNADMMHLGNRVTSVSQDLDGEKLTLIGWSLGGVLTREVARLFPNVVQEVITLGTPIVGGPKFTSVGKRYAKRNNIDIETFELDVHQRNCIGLTQPVTSIYSKSDGVVGWQASVDIYNQHATNLEVTGSHMGLGVNPEVWLTIADVLEK